MTSLPESTLTLLGLAGSGKTNFLVALDVVLDDQKDPEGLVHSELAADRAYLQPLREQWLLCEEFKRTDRQNPPSPHQFVARHPKSDAKTGFYLPDVAGESFDDHFEARSLPADFVSRVRQSAGLLLFVHAGEDADHVIHESRVFVDPPEVGGEGAPKGTEPPKGWGLKNASRQVKLVDLLQFIEASAPPRVPMRVAVIVSAWDLVENAPAAAEAEAPKEPTRFLSVRWPLLSQYLTSRSDMFIAKAYGVSARGGENTAAEITRLTGLKRPSDRVQVVDGLHRSNDISRPVRWLLGMPGTTS